MSVTLTTFSTANHQNRQQPVTANKNLSIKSERASSVEVRNALTKVPEKKQSKWPSILKWSAIVFGAVAFSAIGAAVGGWLAGPVLAVICAFMYPLFFLTVVADELDFQKSRRNWARATMV